MATGQKLLELRLYVSRARRPAGVAPGNVRPPIMAKSAVDSWQFVHTSFCDLLLSKVKPWTTCTARRDPSKIATGDLVSLHFYSLGVRYHVYKAPEATVPLEGDLAHCPKGWSLTSVRHVHMTPKYPGHPFDPTEFLGGCQECQMWCDDGRHVWILAKAVAYPDDQHVLCHLVFYCFVRKEGTGSLLDSVVT